MALNFPNVSRSFLPARGAVQFWGHDGSLEISFFVTQDALKRIQSDAQNDETGLLRAFDLNRATIHENAAKVYSRSRMESSYELTAASF